MAGSRSTANAVTLLRERLDETAAALARADLTALLSCELQLQSALAALASQGTVAGDRAALAVELRRVQASLVRCRRLGATLTDFIQVSLSGMHQEPVTYTFRHSA